MKVIDTASILLLKVLKVITVAAASSLIVASSYALFDMNYTSHAAFSSYNLSQYRPQVENGEPATLDDVEKINPDARAWVTIYGTHIDYPVTQGKDDLEYVNKDVYGKTTPTGSIYLAAENNADFSDEYNLMYGHHMDNGAMFGDIDKFIDKDFFDSHTKGILITDSGVYDLELFSVMESYAYDKLTYNPKSTGLNIVNYAKANGLHTRNVDNITRVLALSTCDYERTNGRDILFFKMTPHEGEYQPYSIEDTPPPLAILGNDYWALLNLLCLIVTIYNFIPLHVSFSKYRRKRKMKDRNDLLNDDDEETELTRNEKIQKWLTDNGFKDSEEEHTPGFYDTKSFGRKSIIGMLLEFIVAFIALITFILTENMKLPIVLIDEWTPLMLAFLFISWLVDVTLLRIKTLNSEDSEDFEEKSGNR